MSASYRLAVQTGSVTLEMLAHRVRNAAGQGVAAKSVSLRLLHRSQPDKLIPQRIGHIDDFLGSFRFRLGKQQARFQIGQPRRDHQIVGSNLDRGARFR